MTKMTNKVFWDRISSFYARFMKRNTELYDEIAKEISAHLKPEMRVLELGCGTGQFTNILAKSVNRWFATDFSEKMLSHARRSKKNRNVMYSLEDAHAISFPANYFDAIVIANALHVIPNPGQSLHEISRCLKENGLLIAPTFVYDKPLSKFRMKLMQLLGFLPHNKWTSKEFTDYISRRGFETISNSVICDNALSECVLIAKNIK